MDNITAEEFVNKLNPDYIKTGIQEIWSNRSVKIIKDFPVNINKNNVCKHLTSKYIVNSSDLDGIYADCPRILVTEDDEGDNIGICLDCILEEFQK